MTEPINAAPPAFKSISDMLSYWLQGQVNACSDGHASRIERLEDRLQAQDAGLKTLQDEHIKLRDEHIRLRDRVQAMLVPQTMDADALLSKIRDADDFGNLINDVVNSSTFVTAIEEEVFGRKFTDEVKEAVQDLRFEVTVR